MASRVTVIGAGIFGLSCAWECLRRGAEVRVAERPSETLIEVFTQEVLAGSPA